jgi:RNA polymerase sigma-70 factor (ECF subfamily)
LSTTEEIWEKLHRKLRGFFLKRVSDEGIAEELLQMTFLKIHENLGNVNSVERISAWTFQVARNVLIDHYRSQARAAEESAQEIEADSPEEGNLNEEVAGWLPSMIKKLPEKYREALILYEIEGVPQQAIADQLGISLSGAKSRVQRGRSKLKDILLDCCSFQKDRFGNFIDYERKSCCNGNAANGVSSGPCS